MPINERRSLKIKPTIVRTPPKNIVKKQQIINRNNIIPKRENIGKIEKIWNNEVVYIVGGGPSLKDFDWRKLNGKKVIAINRAFQVLPNADVMYWTDARFYRWYKDDITKFKGLKVACRPIPENPSDVIFLKANGSNNVDVRPSYICHGNNSGYGAINLAVKLGAKRIYLLGYDMGSEAKKTHWHDGYNVSHNHTIYTRMIDQFNVLPGLLKNLDVEIWNANIKSKLECFRKCTLDVALNNNPIKPA